MLQRHTGDSYGYRFESQGKVVVYSTDSEHPLAQPEHTERFVRFFHGADLVIFDAMYSLADAISVKADWGHSSNIVGVELCQMAEARHLCLFHHEPVFDDAAIDARAGRDAAPRGDHARSEPAARQRGLRRAGNRAVTPRAERRATAGWIDRIGLVGVVLSLAFAALTCAAAGVGRPAAVGLVRRATSRSLRARSTSLPVTVVEIDQKSVAAIGQWPWPRTQLAQLVNTINRAGAAAIGAQRADARGRRVVARAAAR